MYTFITFCRRDEGKLWSSILASFNSNNFILEIVAKLKTIWAHLQPNNEPRHVGLHLEAVLGRQCSLSTQCQLAHQLGNTHPRTHTYIFLMF